MNKKKNLYTFKLILLVFLCLQFGNTVLAADQLKQKKSELSGLRVKIQDIQNYLSSAFDKRKKINASLKGEEIKISRLNARMKKIDTALKEQRKALAELNYKEKQSEELLTQQQTKLAKLMITSQHLQKDNHIKLLLNLEHPEKVERMLKYYQYINQAHIDDIKEISQQLELLTNQKKNIRNKEEILKKLQQKKIGEHEKLKNSLFIRKKLLSTLNSSIKTKDEQLSELRTNKLELEKIVHTLHRRHTRSYSGTTSLRKLKGQLAWPTRGRLTKHFGERIGQSELSFNGISISAPADQDIQSVHAGRVVFADWLKGFGLLTIIDHGQGFMSLYAHCNSLYKQRGDSVAAGDSIASVGNSGGFQKNSLYFELRHNGKPVNPEIWLS